MKILIYHHNDNDGYLAAAIADKALSTPYNDIEFRVGKYDDVHDEEAIQWADTVYVLDYSLPLPLMEKYFDKIIWIDHHKTAIDNMAAIEERKGKFAGVRTIGESGCFLTWQYFAAVEKLGNKDFSDMPEIPLVVKLVNDRDVWNWKMGEDTAAFHEASRMFMLYYGTWQEMLDSDAVTQAMVKKGHTLLEFIRDLVDTYNKSFSWDGMFEGHPVVFLNGTGAISGELHKRLRESHPAAKFAVVFMFRHDKVTVGMYRTDGVNDVSLGKLATKYGGGGHDGAAGFYTDYEEWIQVMKESKSASGYKRVNGVRNPTNPRSMS